MTAAANSPPDPTLVDAAEAALAKLRRTGLLRSWTVDTDAARPYTLTVGRGTVSLPQLTPAAVLNLAAALTRDRVRVIGNGYNPGGHRTIRYRMSDGRFADRHEGRAGRYVDSCRYTVYLPGGSASGSAAVHFAAQTQREALALAGLLRVRGACTTCDTARPLDVGTWRPDLNIPCPGCSAGSNTAVTLLCRRCTQPITPYADPLPPLIGTGRAAWIHTGGTPYCVVERDFRRDGFDWPRAHPGGQP